MKKIVVFLLAAIAVPLYSLSLETPEGKYLRLAEKIAQSVEHGARHQPTGLYASLVDVESGTAKNEVTTHHANWYLPGLWMLYWKTGDPKYLEWIDRHSAALWEHSADPETGLPYMQFDLAANKPLTDSAGHRIQYQVAAHGHWDAYLKSLRSGVRYQIVSDYAGRRTVLNNVNFKRPGTHLWEHSPDYFGCLDLRIPYAAGTIEERPELYDAVVDDFLAHLMGQRTTGLWSGGLLVPGPGLFVPENVWTGTIADDTYTGLILYDLTGRPELLEIVTRQTELALKYCYHPEGHYFYRGVSTLAGKPLDPGPRWHTNWEWALTLFILHDMTGDEKWLSAGEENYAFLMNNIDNPGHYSPAEGDDWNVPQVALLSIFRYHQTGDPKYLEDARRVADYLIEHRLRTSGDLVYIGEDRYMDIREAGDFLCMLVCLSDRSLPVISSRYFLYPVGIRSPSFPVFEEAYVSRYSTRHDGALLAEVSGGEGMTEDVWIMDLSGEVDKVLLNGREVGWRAQKIAGQRYLVLESVALGSVKIEVYSR